MRRTKGLMSPGIRLCSIVLNAERQLGGLCVGANATANPTLDLLEACHAPCHANRPATRAATRKMVASEGP